MTSINTTRDKTAQFVVDHHGHRVWEFQGGCLAPPRLWVRGLPDPVLEKDKKPVMGWMMVRCRKCPDCLEHRANLWAARACTELNLSYRTWFGTLTYRPEERFRVLTEARHTCRETRFEDFDELGPNEQFRILAKVSGADVTNLIKRVRHAHRIRYLLVCEQHKDGFPHWHVLVHEISDPISKRKLEEQWRFGFSHWRLVNPDETETAFYVCKYLAKTRDCRVRNSFRYGTVAAHPRVKAVHNAVKAVTRENQSSSLGTPPASLGDRRAGTEGAKRNNPL